MYVHGTIIPWDCQGMMDGDTLIAAPRRRFACATADGDARGVWYFDVRLAGRARGWWRAASVRSGSRGRDRWRWSRSRGSSPAFLRRNGLIIGGAHFHSSVQSPFSTPSIVPPRLPASTALLARFGLPFRLSIPFLFSRDDEAREDRRPIKAEPPCRPYGPAYERHMPYADAVVGEDLMPCVDWSCNAACPLDHGCVSTRTTSTPRVLSAHPILSEQTNPMRAAPRGTCSF